MTSCKSHPPPPIFQRSGRMMAYLVLFIATSCLWKTHHGVVAFVILSSSSALPRRHLQFCRRRPSLVELAASSATTETALPDPSSMRISQIRDELKERGVKFDDCFDKESLVERLLEARSLLKTPTSAAVDSESVASDGEQDKADNSPPTNQQHDDDNSDIYAQVSLLSVKALRSELARRQIRWAGLLEKSDLVRAVVEARIKAQAFSVTGLLSPGQVTDLTGDQVLEELRGSDAPLLVDVYATWCGPCQMMAPQLQGAAQDLGDQVRVVKMDSDQHPAVASEWKVQGLPTLILFHHGQQVDRIEGALMQQQLVEWVHSKLT